MSLPQFRDIFGLSDKEISEKIIEMEQKLANLRFKKATRQSFKSHKIKHTKRQLSQLKTYLTLKLESRE